MRTAWDPLSIVRQYVKVLAQEGCGEKQLLVPANSGRSRPTRCGRSLVRDSGWVGTAGLDDHAGTVRTRKRSEFAWRAGCWRTPVPRAPGFLQCSGDTKADQDSDIRIEVWLTASGWNGNLKQFVGHGGKLLLYHGWSDQLITPLNSISYSKSVVDTTVGALEQWSKRARLPSR